MDTFLAKLKNLVQICKTRSLRVKANIKNLLLGSIMRFKNIRSQFSKEPRVMCSSSFVKKLYWVTSSIRNTLQLLIEYHFAITVGVRETTKHTTTNCEICYHLSVGVVSF